MKLIDDDKKEYTVFLNRDIELEDGEILIGSKVWKEYFDILTDSKLEYSERKVKLSIVAEKMDCFIYKVNALSVAYNNVIGDIFYLDDGEKYFVEGKFDREMFVKKSFEFID